MGMIGIRLGYGLDMLGNGHGNVTGTENGNGNAVAK
jgi:hypothetical protein